MGKKRNLVKAATPIVAHSKIHRLFFFCHTMSLTKKPCLIEKWYPEQMSFHLGMEEIGLGRTPRDQVLSLLLTEL